MSYLYTPMGLSDEQLEALTTSPEEIRKLPPEMRLSYQLRHREVRSSEKAAFWDALATAATLAAALGFGALVGRK